MDMAHQTPHAPEAPLADASTGLEFSDVVVLALVFAAAGYYLYRRSLANAPKRSPFDQFNENLARNKTGVTTAPVPARHTSDSGDFVTRLVEAGKDVVIFFGSQTGTAEDFANRLAKEGSQRFGLKCLVLDIEDCDMRMLSQLPASHLALFVLATYGEGEPTDNAIDFWELLINEDDPDAIPDFEAVDHDADGVDDTHPLGRLHYAIFGLGNSTYENYNHVGRLIDGRLQHLGGHRVGGRGEGDDDRSLEEDFLTWKDSTWPLICTHVGIDFEKAGSQPQRATFNVVELPTPSAEDSPAMVVYHGEPRSKPGPPGLVPTYDVKNPYIAPIAVHRELFAPDARRSCLHLELDINQAQGMSYSHGDHVAVWPVNPEAEVQRLLRVMQLTDKADTLITVEAQTDTMGKKRPFPVPTTYITVLRHCLDIVSPPSRQFFNTLLAFAKSSTAQDYLYPLTTDKVRYADQVLDARRTLGEVLETIVARERAAEVSAEQAFAIPFAYLLDEFARILPRYYSISSSPKCHPTSVHLTAVVLEYTPTPTPDRTVYGVCTNYFRALHHHAQAHEVGSDPVVAGQPSYLLRPNPETQQFEVAMFIRHSNFKLPRLLDVPVIMVGPGTGVAPFRGFIMERAQLAKTHPDKALGPMLLFYGCRSQSQDYLYQNEWPQYFAHLPAPSQVFCAFSRDQPEKVYVQHLLRQQQELLWQFIHERNAYFYVCGDARHMARDVNKALVDIAESVGQLPHQQAVNYVKNLRGQGRYQEDVWT